mgnify:CR=1 FL=1
MSEVKAPTRPGEWLEHQVWLPAIMGLLTLGWIVLQFATKPVLTVMSSLNGYLFVFLMLGLVLHGTPARFLQAVTKAVPATAGTRIGARASTGYTHGRSMPTTLWLVRAWRAHGS